MSRATVVAVVVAVAGCTQVNRATLVASTTTLVCDWAQTRSSASAHWSGEKNGMLWEREEQNPILGTHPSTRAVDMYFTSAAVLNLGLWLLLPARYKAVPSIGVVSLEARSILINTMTTRNDDTGNRGICGL